MFAGPLALNFQRAQNEGRTFIGETDRMARFRIDDRGSQLKKPAIDFIRAHTGTTPQKRRLKTHLGSLLEHPELYDNYPELYSLHVTLYPNERMTWEPSNSTHGSVFAQVTHGMETQLFFPLETPPHKLKSALMHEVQHLIQGIEGFATGGSPEKQLRLLLQERAQILVHRWKRQKDSGKLPENIEIGSEFQPLEIMNRIFELKSFIGEPVQISDILEVAGNLPSNYHHYANRYARLAHQRYVFTPGEIEARLVQQELDVAADQKLPVKPSIAMTGLSKDRKRGFRSRPYDAPKMADPDRTILRLYGKAARTKDKVLSLLRLS